MKEKLPKQISENKPLNYENVIKQIEEKFNIKYREEEKKEFDSWEKEIRENSFESPIVVNNIDNIFRFLPKTANYHEDKMVNIFFKKDNFSDSELNKIFEIFSDNNPGFEISMVRHRNNTISIGIGNKVRNASTILSENTEYFGHYHPTSFDFENKDELPRCFVAGLMPSAGDIKGYLKRPELIKKSTKIFSKNGFVKISLISDNVEVDEEKFNNFKKKYFELFLGNNEFGLRTDKEMSKMLERELGLRIEFYYNNKK